MSNDHSYHRKKPQDWQPTRILRENKEEKSKTESCSDNLQNVLPEAPYGEEYVDSQCTETSTSSQSEYHPDEFSQISAVQVSID